MGRQPAVLLVGAGHEPGVPRVERLAAAGLVVQRSVVREGTRPPRCTGCPPGETAVRAWLASPPGPPVLRHPVALRVFFGHLLDPGELRAAIESHRAWCDDMLAQLGEVRSELGDDAVAQRRPGGRVGPRLLPGRAGGGRRHRARREPARWRGPRRDAARGSDRTNVCSYTGAVGFNNPDVPWSEIERTLSDRKPGGDPHGWWSTGGARAPRPPAPPTCPRGRTGATARPGRPTGPAYQPPAGLDRRPSATPYAELHCHSNFSFLDGASHPEELAEEAARLGLEALAITDHDGLYGVVRFAEAARAVGVPTVFGAELSLGLTRPQNGEADPEGDHLLVLARDPEGYARLASTLSAGHLAGHEKGRPDYSGVDWAAAHGGHWVVLTGCRKGAVPQALLARARRPRPASWRGWSTRSAPTTWRSSCATTATRSTRPATTPWPRWPCGRASTWWPPTTSTTPRPTAGAWPRPWPRCGPGAASTTSAGWLPAAGTAHLRSGDEQARRFARWPGAVERAAELGRACAFDLALVAPRLPPFPCPDGLDEMAYLRRLTEEGATRRYGPRGGADPRATATATARPWAQIDHELAVIEALGFPGYFLVVWDIVELLPPVEHLLPGPGQRRQLGGLLRAGHHQRRRGVARPAVRALPVARARRPARHRHRHRERPAGGGHPVRLPAPRPPPRGPGGQRHQLPGPLGGARHGQGARLLARPAGRLVEADGHVVDGGVDRRARGPTATTSPARCWRWPARSSGRPATWASTRGAWSSATGPSSRCARSSGGGSRAGRRCATARPAPTAPPWATSWCPCAPCCSGTRTTARRWAW